MLLFSLAFAAVPEISEPVTDLANVLDDESTLEGRIRDLRQKTGVQVAVLTVDTVGAGHTIESFSLETAEKWGGGEAGIDEGLLIVLAVSDRRSRIEVGYGLEGYVTDAEAGALLAGASDHLRAERYDTAMKRIVAGLAVEVDELVAGERSALHGIAGQARRWWPAETWSIALFEWVGFLTTLAFGMSWRRGPPRTLSTRLPRPLLVGFFCALPIVGLLAFYRLVEGPWTVLRAIQFGGGATMAVSFAFAATARRFWTGLGILAVLMTGVFVADLLAEDALQGMPWTVFGLVAPWLFFMALTDFAAGGGSGGGVRTHDSTGSYGSSSSSSSSSSGSSGGGDWGGGGGGFGGGGASGSW